MDMRKVLGRNLHKITELCKDKGIKNLSLTVVKRELTYANIPDDETWRIGIIHDMQNMRQDDAYASENDNEVESTHQADRNEKKNQV